MHILFPYKGSISAMNVNEFGFIVIARITTTGKGEIQLTDRSLDGFGAQMGRHGLPLFSQKGDINFLIKKRLSPSSSLSLQRRAQRRRTDSPILVLKDKDPFAKRRWLTIPATALALRRKIPGYLFGPRISYDTRFPDIASRIPLEPNHMANPIVLDREIPNLLIKRVGSAIARQARPPHWFPGNCFGHVENNELKKRVREYSIPSLPLGEKDQFLATGLSTGKV